MTTRTKAKQAADSVKSVAADVQTKAKEVYAKGAEVVEDMGTMTKANLDAVVASGKILGAGFKELGKDSIAEGKKVVDTFAADFEAFKAVKSPKEFFELQMKLAKRNFDDAIALTGKNGKALGKLASEAAAPLSSQVKANLAKLNKAA